MVVDLAAVPLCAAVVSRLLPSFPHKNYGRGGQTKEAECGPWDSRSSRGACRNQLRALITLFVKAFEPVEPSVSTGQKVER
jgi:hypothetical protein